MLSSCCEEIAQAFDALDADLDRLCELSFDALTTQERLRILQRLEKMARRLPVPGHALINQVAEQASPEELGDKLSHELADRLRITRGEANRRIADAADLGPRRALTGEPLLPRLPATAAAQREGAIGAGHVRVIRRFVDELPCSVDIETREKAEAHLAVMATEHRPDDLTKLAERLAAYLNPDGTYTDEDRANRRGLILGKQDIDGMSRLTGWLTPEARATIEAVLAKTASPGLCNPDDDTPVVDGPPDEDTARRDTRSPAQRNHDGLNAALRAVLASGRLGQHNGLPASIVVGERLHDERGRVVGTQGFYIDATPDEREQQDQMTAQLAVIAENRAVIEQAKGVLMAAYGITANRAFEILKWRSQETNVKIRELASQFMATISAKHLSPESRSQIDHTLLTLR
jgi:hypothetical protein